MPTLQEPEKTSSTGLQASERMTNFPEPQSLTPVTLKPRNNQLRNQIYRVSPLSQQLVVQGRLTLHSSGRIHNPQQHNTTKPNSYPTIQ